MNRRTCAPKPPPLTAADIRDVCDRVAEEYVDEDNAIEELFSALGNAFADLANADEHAVERDAVSSADTPPQVAPASATQGAIGPDTLALGERLSNILDWVATLGLHPALGNSICNTLSETKATLERLNELLSDTSPEFAPTADAARAKDYLINLCVAANTGGETSKVDLSPHRKELRNAVLALETLGRQSTDYADALSAIVNMPSLTPISDPYPLSVAKKIARDVLRKHLRDDQAGWA